MWGMSPKAQILPTTGFRKEPNGPCHLLQARTSVTLKPLPSHNARNVLFQEQKTAACIQTWIHVGGGRGSNGPFPQPKPKPGLPHFSNGQRQGHHNRGLGHRSREVGTGTDPRGRGEGRGCPLRSERGARLRTDWLPQNSPLSPPQDAMIRCPLGEKCVIRALRLRHPLSLTAILDPSLRRGHPCFWLEIILKMPNLSKHRTSSLVQATLFWCQPPPSHSKICEDANGQKEH